jgi:hypothetical protein
MKNSNFVLIIVFLFLSLFILTIYTKVVFAEEVSIEETCLSTSLMAKVIMENRQSGVPMSSMMEVLSREEYAPLKKVSTMFLIRAYEAPRWNSENLQKQEIIDFQNQIYLECIKSFGE